ncbi:MAG: hypothetical protein ACRDHY_05170 [Anaerolineales bacterium]
MSDPVTTALITFLSAVGTFVSLAAFLGRRIDRVGEKIERLDEKLDRKFDVFMLELLRHVREGHPPNAAA